MKSLIILEIDHVRDIPALGEMIAGRAYNIQGVTNAEFVKDMAKLPVYSTDRLKAMGFTADEIHLGDMDVERGS